ncbi:hypothetical protein MGSAQ_002456 [marine sediment metagenome]|uniref:Uncharacterized protein n=1 Tax=marine sediment metagenome TaxID=412755 RepID=A0A1B6NRF9_9ZZZZ
MMLVGLHWYRGLSADVAPSTAFCPAGVSIALLPPPPGGPSPERTITQFPAIFKEPSSRRRSRELRSTVCSNDAVLRWSFLVMMLVVMMEVFFVLFSVIFF